MLAAPRTLVIPAQAGIHLLYPDARVHLTSTGVAIHHGTSSRRTPGSGSAAPQEARPNNGAFRLDPGVRRDDVRSGQKPGSEYGFRRRAAAESGEGRVQSRSAGVIVDVPVRRFHWFG